MTRDELVAKLKTDPRWSMATAVTPIKSAADLALVLGHDGALVRQLSAAFGGPRTLDDRSRLFIENWEVESYRAKQA